jgi:effector-binding domain-containing protein
MKFMKIIVIIIIALVIIIAAAVLIFAVFMQGPDVSQFEYLKDPRIAAMSDTKVVQVVVTGSPEKALPSAFSLLYSAYFKVKNLPKGGPQSAPLLRLYFPEGASVPRLSSEGALKDSIWYIGLPVPENAVLAEPVVKGELKAEIATWNYGEVAEILHIGPYDKETPAIEKLETFVKSKGYRFKGVHEEVYLRGPGMLFSNPEKYYTIIRYLVEKTE